MIALVHLWVESGDDVLRAGLGCLGVRVIGLYDILVGPVFSKSI